MNLTKQLTTKGKLRMKRTDKYQWETEDAPSAAPGYANARDSVAKAKQKLLVEYNELVGKDFHLLRLALNEAEALAWNTEFPHLFFPALAVEKAHAAVDWHRRQRALRHARTELAFAE
jgi:hypothetical protein